MTRAALDAIAAIIQHDVGKRGLATDPNANLISASAGDFQAACRSLAETENAAVAIVTGFYIAHADPPAGETDGPLGAVFLARSLAPLGIRAALITDAFCRPALEAGLTDCGLNDSVPLLTLPGPDAPWPAFLANTWQEFAGTSFAPTHLIALERVGPSHTAESVEQQPGSAPHARPQFEAEIGPEQRDRCYSMRGRDITRFMSPAHRLFEAVKAQPTPIATIGIGDGGNEIGMGKVPWEVVRCNIPRGGLVACRVPTDRLIVCGVSNWGAYGLAAGVYHLRGRSLDTDLFDPQRERALLELMVRRGPLVDGVSGKPSVSVDGLDFERYAEPLRRIWSIAQ
jgi:hypothetical protein